VTSNRRQQDRDRRRRQRRGQRRQSRQQTGVERVGPVQFSGPMGLMQRHTRSFFLGGIVVMVLSLGGIFFTTNLGASSPQDPTPTPTATAESTAESSATPEDEEIVRSYEAAPELTIDPEATYEAVIHLEGGDVRIELYAAEAPIAVNNFVFLAENRFYDGLTFHRVLPGFVAQTGDPTAAGSGSPGYQLEAESNDLTFERGVLSMAQSPAGISGSQFFITLGPAPHLNADFTVFGRVIEGIELLDELTPRDPSEPDQPEGDRITSIEILPQGS